jgi:hypothetical protein
MVYTQVTLMPKENTDLQGHSNARSGTLENEISG